MARPEIAKTELGRRLRALRGEIDRDEWARRLGFSKTTIANYERGDRKPEADFIEALVERVGVDLNALFGQPSAMGGGVNDNVPGGLAYVDRLELQVSAGPGASGDTIPIDPIPFSPDVLRRNSLRADELAVLEVRGDSMEPVLYAGDLVMVDKAPSKPVSGKMYVVARGSDVQIKWVTVMRSAIQLVSENEHYPPERVDPHDGPRFYRVRWFGHFIP